MRSVVHELAEVAQEARALDLRDKVVAVVDVLAGELDRRARLDIAPRVDVVAHSVGGGAEGPASVVVIRIDDDDRLAAAHVHHEAPHLDHLLGGQGQLRAGVGAGRPVAVVPDVVGAKLDHPVEVFLADHVGHVGLAYAGGRAGEKSVPQAIGQAVDASPEDVAPAAALVADHLAALDADQRSYVARGGQPGRDVVGKQRAVGE